MSAIGTYDQTTLFSSTRRCVAWLDGTNLKTREEYGLRILKLCEEAGEVAQAWIGYTGQNPRKGVTHTKNDVCQELADVVITAMVALESLSQSSMTVLHDRLRYVESRVAQPEGMRVVKP
jgi:NTP pyrophosphatase (non-canonical NTP hydrolase)